MLGGRDTTVALVILDKTTCALCNEVLREDDDLVATQHFIRDQADPLWQYSDAAMHRRCFTKWQHREEFREKYNETMGATVWGNKTRHHMEPDGTIAGLPANAPDGNHD